MISYWLKCSRGSGLVTTFKTTTSSQILCLTILQAGLLVLNNWKAYPDDIETLEKLRKEVKFWERGEQGLGRNSENLHTPPGLTWVALISYLQNHSVTSQSFSLFLFVYWLFPHTASSSIMSQLQSLFECFSIEGHHWVTIDFRQVSMLLPLVCKV